MPAQENTNAFFAAPDAYNDFMGRYAKPLAQHFVKSIPLNKGNTVLDLGCGPGALTGELVAALGAGAVSVVDPSPPFLEACVDQFPGITGKVGRAEEIPFDDNAFDAVMSQLVLHFIGDLSQAGKEIVRVTKPGGSVAVCTWVFGRMEMVTLSVHAVNSASSNPPGALRVHAFDEDGAIVSYLESIGLEDVTESTISVQSRYNDFDELWQAQLRGVGPMGPWMQQQPDDELAAIESRFFELVGSPDGAFSLNAVARSGVGRKGA